MMQKLCSFLSISFAAFLAMAAIGPQALAEDARFLRGQLAANDGNYAAAMEVWLPLAREGHVKAQYGVGSLHAEGQGTPLDMTEALVWWRLAAEQGDDRTQFNIAAMYKAGLGAVRDDVRNGLLNGAIAVPRPVSANFMPKVPAWNVIPSRRLSGLKSPDWRVARSGRQIA